MSKSNYVSLYGTLIKDAVIKTNDKGNEYALFTLSVPQDGTKWCDYINCIAFGDTAAILKDNLGNVFIVTDLPAPDFANITIL